MLPYRSCFAITVLAACGLHAQTANPRPSVSQGAPAVTAISGESWLTRLNRSFDNTSMGKTGRLGPGHEEEAAAQAMPVGQIFSSRKELALHGSDLYRLNCQGCHGEAGLGAPPEINSIINPVRATSVPLVVLRVKNAGMDLTYSDAAKMAQQSQVALLERLHKGGESMPAFSHLSDAEIRALLAYLRKLADVPNADKDQPITVASNVRVGELIVKSTCHTCHSATGSNPGPRELMAGAIPPLSTLPERKDLPGFVRKVTVGSPVMMGTPPISYRGRMPVFYYLTSEEAADVYLYLTLYPPSGRDTTPLVAALQNANPPSSGNGPASRLPVLVAGTLAPEREAKSEGIAWTAIVLSGLVVLVVMGLAGGLYFTFREFRRLSAESNGRVLVVSIPEAESGPEDLIQMNRRILHPVMISSINKSPR